MLSVFQVKQGPQLRVSPDNNAASPASVASIGPAFWIELFPVEMQASSSAASGTGIEFYIVYEIRSGHRINRKVLVVREAVISYYR
jgi:hypothetical protein